MLDHSVNSLILDLLEWLGRQERSYMETMDAWRTSCPRLPVWEDANDQKLIEVTKKGFSGDPIVRVTAKGKELLLEKRGISCAL